MYWQFNPFIVPIILGLMPLVYFAYRAYYHRSTLAAQLFMAGAIASIATLTLYILELLSADPELLVMWVRTRFIFAVFIPSIALLFTLAYLGFEKWVTWKISGILSLQPLLTLFAVWTNDTYHLQWTYYTTKYVKGLLFAHYRDAFISPVFWMGQLHIFAVTIIMIGVVVLAMLRSRGVLRGQAMFILLSILCPATGILFELFGLRPIPNLNWPVFTLGLSALPLGMALFRYRLLDIVPTAQSMVLQSMQDAVLVLDLQGRIVQANPAAIALRRRHSDAIVGQAGSVVFSDFPHLVERFDNIFDAHEIIEVNTSKNTLCYFDLRISPLKNTDKQITGRILVLRDVSATKQAEQQALDLALERERTHLLKSFISDTSHDIMTPISVLRVSSYLIRVLTDKISLAASDAKNSPDEAAAAFTILETSINALREKSTNLDASALRLQMLVEGMLEMVKLDKQVFTFEPTNLNLLAEQAVNLQRFLAEEKGIRLSLDAAPELPKAELDSNQIIRVLQNLLTNALKYTPQGGSVTVRTRHTGNQVVVDIQDTGSGIPAEDLPHIFERLYRVDKTRAVDSEGVGLGLGLAIVKTIVTAHQGTVEVESTVGVGSTFSVILPALEHHPETDPLTPLTLALET